MAKVNIDRTSVFSARKYGKEIRGRKSGQRAVMITEFKAGIEIDVDLPSGEYTTEQIDALSDALADIFGADDVNTYVSDMGGCDLLELASGKPN